MIIIFRVIKKIKLIVGEYFKIKLLLPIGFYDKRLIDQPISEEWKCRIQNVLDCPDNTKISRVFDAGGISKGYQVMHNGIKITLGGYYGPPISQMLLLNKGVHEPQEEYVFNEVIKEIPSDGVMIELGSYWSFYSLSFLTDCPARKCIMVEPDRVNILYGKNNFKINRLKGIFVNAFIDEKPCKKLLKSVPTLSVDYILESYSLSKVNILHADIQGFEYKMLLGSFHSLSNNKIDFLFISTHSNELHNLCIELLSKFNYHIICDANLDESYSCDGLIVARSGNLKFDQIDISKRG